MTKPPERILAWTVNEWGSAWAVAPEDAAADAVEYIRADLVTQRTPDPVVQALVEAGNRMANSIKGDYIHPGAATAWDAALAAFDKT